MVKHHGAPEPRQIQGLDQKSQRKNETSEKMILKDFVTKQVVCFSVEITSLVRK